VPSRTTVLLNFAVKLYFQRIFIAVWTTYDIFAKTKSKKQLLKFRLTLRDSKNSRSVLWTIMYSIIHSSTYSCLSDCLCFFLSQCVYQSVVLYVWVDCLCLFDILVADDLVWSVWSVLLWSSSEATVGYNQMKFVVPHFTGHRHSAVDCVSDIHMCWELDGQWWWWWGRISWRCVVSGRDGCHHIRHVGLTLHTEHWNTLLLYTTYYWTIIRHNQVVLAHDTRCNFDQQQQRRVVCYGTETWHKSITCYIVGPHTD